MRSIRVIAMVGVAASLFAGCGGGTATLAPPSAAPATQAPASAAPATQAAASTSACGPKKLKLGYVALHLDTYFVSVQKGIENALGDCGELTVISMDDDASKEAQAYQDLLSKQVDAVFSSPFDATGSVTGLKALSDGGIPVICYNTCINPDDMAKYVKGFVLSDNASLGALTANVAVDYINKNMAGQDIVVADLNCDKFDVCKLRTKGFYDTLDKSGIKYKVAQRETSYIADQTLGVAEGILTAHPDVNVFWSATDGGGAGEVKAVDNQGKTGKTFVFSTDMTQTLGQALLAEPPVLITTTGQDGDGQGAALVAMAETIASGGTPAQTTVLVPGVNFNRDNPDAVNAWLAANK